MNDYIRLAEIFDNIETGGIFNALQGRGTPWENEDIAIELDTLYFYNISGNKIISPLVSKIKSGTVLTDEEIEKLADIIYAVNNKNWERVWEADITEYNPLDNYNMEENLTNDITEIEYGRTDTRTDNLTRTESEQSSDSETQNLTHSKTGTEQTSGTSSGTNSDKIYGFNSSTGRDSTSGETTGTSSGTITYNTTDTDGGTRTGSETSSGTETQSGTVENEQSGTDTKTHSYNLTRTGNIGVTTSQQMLQAEREARIWNYFYNFVFPSIDKILTIDIY